mmetsp:Transcript_42242/g.100199  ORF Transcript_42242/g.100199 Transcript_42242/m.100199 type:complete len:217 (-) Transcript_42242:1042-1692(-)
MPLPKCCTGGSRQHPSHSAGDAAATSAGQEMPPPNPPKRKRPSAWCKGCHPRATRCPGKSACGQALATLGEGGSRGQTETGRRWASSVRVLRKRLTDPGDQPSSMGAALPPPLSWRLEGMTPVASASSSMVTSSSVCALAIAAWMAVSCSGVGPAFFFGAFSVGDPFACGRPSPGSNVLGASAGAPLLNFSLASLRSLSLTFRKSSTFSCWSLLMT